MPRCGVTWNLFQVSPDGTPYSSWLVAQATEDAMKQPQFELHGGPIGGEFYQASSGVIERVWRAGRRAADEREKCA